MRRFTTLAAVTVTAALCASSAFAQKQLKPKSQKEGQAINAMIQAPDPDARIKAAEELITKFADTDFKGYALYLEADAYQQKGDAEKAIVYGEKCLEADPKNYQGAILLAKMYAQTTKINDLDKAEKLSNINKYGNLALELLKTAEKPNAQLGDADWAGIKKDFEGQVYFSLGVAATYGNKLDDAKADFTKVAEMDSDPTDLIRAGRTLQDVKKYAESIEWFDKAAASPNANDQIKKIAASDKARSTAMLPKK